MMNEFKIQARILWGSFLLLSAIILNPYSYLFSSKGKTIFILAFAISILLPGFLFNNLSKKRESSTKGKVGMWILSVAILICFLIIFAYLPADHTGGDYGALVLIFIPPIYIIGLLIAIILALFPSKIQR